MGAEEGPFALTCSSDLGSRRRTSPATAGHGRSMFVLGRLPPNRRLMRAAWMTLALAGSALDCGSHADEQPRQEGRTRAQVEFRARCNKEAAASTLKLFDCDCLADTQFPRALRARARKLPLRGVIAKACERGSWSWLDSRGVQRWIRVPRSAMMAIDARILEEEEPAILRTSVVPLEPPCEVLTRYDSAGVDALVELMDDPDKTWAHVMLDIGDELECRSEKQISAKAAEDCGRSPDVDCECFIREYVDYWLTTKVALGSNTLVNSQVIAASACRRKGN